MDFVQLQVYGGNRVNKGVTVERRIEKKEVVK